MTTAIYARVSTKNQNADNQISSLKLVAERAGWVVDRVLIDHGISGSKGRKDRPALDELLMGVVNRNITRVMVWDVSRLGRSLQDLISTMKEIQAAGANLYLHNQSIDTSTAAGEAVFGMLAVFASFERSMITERVKSGLDRARREGKKLGRPALKPYIKREILELKNQGMKQVEISQKLKVSQAVISKVLNPKLSPQK